MIKTTYYRFARQLLPSLATFLAGAGALFAADMLIGKFMPSETVADWALLKSILFPLAAICLLGMDQMVVREPSKWKTLRAAIFLQLLVLAFVGSFAVAWLGFNQNVAVLFLAVFGMALCNLYFGLFRANLAFTWAQIARDGWKVLFLAGTVAVIFSKELSIQIIAVMALASGAVLSFLIFPWIKKEGVRQIFDEVHSYKSALSISIPFALTAIALSIASFGEVAVLAMLGDQGIVAEYFVTHLCFISTIMIFNTYLSTILGSMVRQNAERSVEYITRFLMPGIAAVLILPFIMFAIGWIVQTLIFPEQPIHYGWALFMAATAGLRFVYTFISISVGALGNRREITQISLQYFLLGLAFPVISYAFSTVMPDIGMAVAAAATVHWLARSIAGLLMSRKIVRRYRENQS